MSREKRSFAQQTCVKNSGLVLHRTGTLWPGCRIGVAVSGGVDSFVLLKVLKIRQGILPFSIEIMALHCNPGFDRQSHASLLSWLAREGIAGHIEIGDFGPRAHSEENRARSACFRCAWLRRKRLFELCAQYGLTHLAIGHNANDLLATFLLNFCRNGRVAGMGMDESFFGGSLRVIRPLLLVEKKYIRQAARQWELPIWENTCPSNGFTARTGTDEILDAIRKIIPNAPRSMLNGLCRWQLDLDAHAIDEKGSL